MCLILFAYRSHPDYPLIVAANRDEFFSRPTKPARFWEDHPTVLAGLDLRAGGTWMGITRRGRFAAVTNFREGTDTLPASDTLAASGPADTAGNSRGDLTREFLTGADAPEQYLRTLVPRASQYRGFSLLVGDRHSLYYYSNRGDKSPRKLPPGVYGLSNSLLNVPWPKVRAGRAALEEVLRQPLDKSRLLSILRDRHPAPDSELPDTGVPLEWERALSSRFIRCGDYGTRASTVLTIDSRGKVEFTEHSFDTAGDGAVDPLQTDAGGDTIADASSANFSFFIPQ